MGAHSPHEALTLSAGDLRAEICPQIGGSLSGFWSQTPSGRIDWMRRAGPAEIAAGDALGMASYPLVPFSNRIRGGQFSFEGKEIRLPLNFLPHPHVIHGHGWRAPWQVVERTRETARIEYRHAPDAWPWPYRAEQRLALDAGALRIAISLTNLADSPMPAGIGLHPHFPRDSETVMRGEVAGVWESDAEVMPTRLVPAQTIWPAGSGLEVDRTALDNCFTGWSRTLDIEWATPRRSLTVTASQGLDFLVVFTPPGQPFFCAEPVSHMIDAFNLAGTRPDTGMVALAPGKTLSAEVVFRPSMP